MSMSEDALDTSLNALQETLQDTLREKEDGDEGGSTMSMLVATTETAPTGRQGSSREYYRNWTPSGSVANITEIGETKVG